MAILYQATLRPSKIELLSDWIPTRPWTGGLDLSTLTPLGAYRFDDPDGQVGIETHLLHAGGAAVLQVPVTYRPAPVPGRESSLLATTEHSVLGRRWVYDACADPVYAAALALAILTGGAQADLDVVTDTGRRRREPTTRVAGSGSPGTVPQPLDFVTAVASGTTTVIRAVGLELVVRHVLDPLTARAPGDLPALRGTWPGQDLPTLLAFARPA